MRSRRHVAGPTRASRPAGDRHTARRHGAGLAIGLALVGGAVLGLAAPASAHNYVIASTPAVDATLTSLPKAFEITTNDKLLAIGGSTSGFAFRVVGPDGRYHEDGCVAVDGPSMTTAAALGKSGEYTVEWQLVSADGHTVSDRYDFRWQAPAGFSPDAGSAKPPVCADAADGASGGASSGGSDGAGASGASDGAGASGASDAVWIGAGGFVVVAAVVVTLLLLRRRPEPPADDE